MGLLRRVAAVLGLLALCWTTGCAGFWVAVNNSGGSTTNDYVYVANANTETLAGFQVTAGTLTAVPGSPYSLGFVPAAVVVNAANTIVFVAGSNGIDGFINTYSIGTGGALSLMTSNNLGSGSDISIDVSPDGKWLLGLDANGPPIDEAIVDVYQINSATGGLLLGNGASFTVPSGTGTIVPRALKIAPNGDYVFVALGTAGDLVCPFTESNNIPLSSPQTLLFQSGANISDNALAVSSDEKVLFIARSGTLGGVASYTIGAGGALSNVSGSPIAAGTQPFSVAIDTAGKDVYVANRGDSTITGYSIGSGGVLTALNGSANGSSYSSGKQVTALAVDNSGDYLLAAANGGSDDLTLYSYDSTTTGNLVYATSTSTGNIDPTGPVAIATTH